MKIGHPGNQEESIYRNRTLSVQGRVGKLGTKESTDAFVIGGGPAGLAAAISLRRAGMNVVLADPAQPGIDKACGEGLLPDGLAALSELGVKIPPAKGHSFRGITFRSATSAASAIFPQGWGLGIRRTVLHNILVEHALSFGVRMLWGAPANVLAHGRIACGGAEWTTQWIVGADGQRSRVRHFAHLDRPPASQRYGFRQHFCIAPWTDCVEVYWAREGQAYVTATGENEVCVALAMDDKSNRMADLHRIFPLLAERLAACDTTSSERGAATICRRLPQVTRGSVALIGDAAGSIDAVTGEGLTLAFKQAVALGQTLPQGDTQRYEATCRRLRQMPYAISRAMVLFGRHPRLLHRFIQASERDPRFFSALMSLHFGTRPRLSPAGVTNFGWNFVTG